MFNREAELYREYFKNRPQLGIILNEENVDETLSKYCNFKYEDLLSPFELPNIDLAVDRLDSAIKKREKILIYADYDCDGIPGAVILNDLLKKINKSDKVNDEIVFDTYIPDRHKEGYGIHEQAIDNYIKQGFTLMITTDLGITNINEIEYAEKHGMSVILTDHHLPAIDMEGKQVIPPAHSVINVQIANSKYENTFLSGAATSWKFVHAFVVKHGKKYNIEKGWEKWSLDMVAISTVADLMKIRGENRHLVSFGLKVLAITPRVGLRELIKEMKISKNGINETDISFGIAPKINAAGRLAHPKIAFNALSLNGAEAINAAKNLNSLNDMRKVSVKDIFDKIKDTLNIYKEEIIFLGDVSYPIGVLGLLASKICENTGKSAIVWGSEDGLLCRASSRSGLNKLNMFVVSNILKQHLVSFGGHEGAGGMVFDINNIEEIQKAIRKIKLTEDNLIGNGSHETDSNIVDLNINSNEVGMKLYNSIRRIGPFGVDNPAPIFKISYKNKIVRRFGKENNHTELIIDGVSCIKFNTTKEEHEILAEEDIIGNIEYDNWKDSVRVRLL